MSGMTVTSLVAVVAPRTGKFIKNWKRGTFATKWYITLCI